MPSLTCPTKPDTLAKANANHTHNKSNLNTSEPFDMINLFFPIIPKRFFNLKYRGSKK